RVTGHRILPRPCVCVPKLVAPHSPGSLADKPEMQLSFNLPDRVVDLVREGYDLSIRIGGAVDPNFVAVKLASNRRVVCGTPGYFRQHGRPKSLDDLLKHNCLAFNLQGGQNRGWYFQRHGKIATMRVAGNLDCNDGELLHRWVAEGLGLGWRSTWEIAAQLETGELETVLDEYALPDYDILAVYPQQRYVPARVRYFIDYLRAAYASPGYWSTTP
ncbi:LysR family transcriptional regulator, partial [Burkholderia contaminans]